MEQPLTKIEQEIYDILKLDGVITTEGRKYLNSMCRTEARKIAQVAKKYIEKAFEAGEDYCIAANFGKVPNPKPNKDKWLKDNGII